MLWMVFLILVIIMVGVGLQVLLQYISVKQREEGEGGEEAAEREEEAEKGESKENSPPQKGMKRKFRKK